MADNITSGNETVNNAMVAFKDRMSDPFIFSFAVSFLVINWQIVFYTASTLPVGAKILAIEGVLSWSSALESLCIALVYTFGYPWFKERVINYYHNWIRFHGEARINKMKMSGWVTQEILTAAIDYNKEFRKHLSDLKMLQKELHEKTRTTENQDKDELSKLILTAESRLKVYLDVAGANSFKHTMIELMKKTLGETGFAKDILGKTLDSLF